MAHSTMEHPGHGNIYLTTLTIILLWFAHFTLSDLAAIFACLAGLSTVLYNWWRYKRDKRIDKTINDKP
jgi:hypothetical protein